MGCCDRQPTPHGIFRKFPKSPSPAGPGCPCCGERWKLSQIIRNDPELVLGPGSNTAWKPLFQPLRALPVVWAGREGIQHVFAWNGRKVWSGGDCLEFAFSKPALPHHFLPQVPEHPQLAPVSSSHLARTGRSLRPESPAVRLKEPVHKGHTAQNHPVAEIPHPAAQDLQRRHLRQ